MNKYIFIPLFYALSGIIIRVMNLKFPGAHDSGIGLGMLGGIHLLILLFSGKFVNWVINGF